jgi:DNA-binding NarL/FixJ family response regulator
MIKVLIADSSELVRVGLKSIFNSSGKVEIAGEACSGTELNEKIKESKPEVVVIDYASSDFDIAQLPEIINQHKEVKFMAITFVHTGITIINAMKCGILSHVKKDCCAEEIVDCVTETAKGNKFFCGSLLDIIRKESIDIDKISQEAFTCAPVILSERELEIISFIAEGFTNQQIADKLFLSAHTVNTHRKNIMAKLGVNNTAGIVMYAVKTNLVSPNKYLFAGQ